MIYIFYLYKYLKKKLLKDILFINCIMEISYNELDENKYHDTWCNNYPYKNFNLEDYIININNIDDVKDLIIEHYNKPTEYVDLVNKIKNYDDESANYNSLIPLFIEKVKQFNTDWKKKQRSIEKYILNDILEPINEFKKLITRNLRDNMLFMKENIVIIEDFVRDLIKEKQEKMKESRKNANKKYYLKIKQELKATLEPIKADEEKVELNEEELALKKIEARKESNRKYYQKIKDKLEQIKASKAQEEPVIDLKERKKLYNQKYYQTRKEKILQFSKNENEQT